MYRISAFADEASPNMIGQIEALTRNGISLIEIRGVDGTNISKIPKDKVKEVRALLDDNGICVWSMGSPIGKIGLDDDFDPHLDAFKRILEYADILGATRVRLFSFYPSEGDSIESVKEKVLARMQKFVDLTPKNIVLCHENEKGIFGYDPLNCLYIHQNLPEVKAVFDPANYIQCGVDVRSAWEIINKYVDYLHIKDALPSGKVVPAGRGIGELSYIIYDYLARGGKVMTLEPHLKVFSGLAELENGESVKDDFVYESNDLAFDTAVAALNKILKEIGE